MSREIKRTASQFLNGLAVAVLVAGTIGPLASGNANLWIVVASIVTGGLFHGIALILVGQGRA